MLLDAILRNNESFLSAQTGPSELASTIAVLTCIDARLNKFIGPAFGASRGEIILVRNAGNVARDAADDPLRSLAMAVYLKGASEIIVLGHTDCAMSQFEANAFLDALSKWGVPRQQLGPIDLRRWAGAFHDVRQNVKRSVEMIGQCQFIPCGVPVHGMLMDTGTGKLEVVCAGYADRVRRGLAPAVAGQAAVKEVEAAAIPDEPRPNHEPPLSTVSTTPPTPSPTTSVSTRPIPTDPMGALKVLGEFLGECRVKPENRAALERMKGEIARQKDARRSIQIVEQTVRRVISERPDVIAALEILRGQVAHSTAGSHVQSLLHQILKG